MQRIRHLLHRASFAAKDDKPVGLKHSPAVRSIYQLTGVDTQVFEQYFLPLLSTVQHLSCSPSAIAQKNVYNFEEWLKRLDKVLRMRQSVLLPKNASAECIASLEEVYTYAVVAAVSLDLVGEYYSSFTYLENTVGIPLHRDALEAVVLEQTAGIQPAISGFGLALAHCLIHREAWRWLSCDARVLRDFVHYFTAKEQSEIHHLVERSVKDMDGEVGGEASIVVAKKPALKTQIKEHRSAAWDFLETVAEAVANGEIAVNQAGAPLWFSRDGRLLLLEERLFSWYANKVGGAAKQHRSRFRRLSIVELRNNRKDRFLAILPTGEKLAAMVVSSYNAERFFGIKTTPNKHVVIGD